MSLADFRPLSLALAVAALMVLVLLVDLALPPGKSGRLLGQLTTVGLLAIFGLSFAVDLGGSAGRGAYFGTAWVTFFQRLFLVAGALAAMGSLDYVARTTPHRQGEYYMLHLLSLLGMMLVPGARDIILFVVSFELMGIPLYVLAAHEKTDARSEGLGPNRAGEAAIKFYLVGATSTAITLFGLSLVVGMCGTTRIAELAATPLQPITVVGLMMVLAGLSFKVGAVPFHMWVPDCYEGAGTPFVAFLSVAPKAGGMAALVTMFVSGAPHALKTWVLAFSLLAAASMIIGNLAALAQRDVRRLLAYSGIGQMGYVMVAATTNTALGESTLLFYLVAYLFSNVGLFLVVHAIAESGTGYELGSLKGLWRRSPWLSLALLVFLLSLAGIPPVAGFWAKLYVFLAAYRAGLTALVVIGALFAVVGLYYYMQVARAAYMTEPETTERIHVSLPLRAAIVVCLLGVVVVGAYPRPLFEAAGKAAASLREVPDRAPTEAPLADLPH
ncbi:MAG: NADH-quinone oxidoreductase subunit N [Polyangiaceae bacterium]